MQERALRVLEFHPFLKNLKAQASSEVGEALCLALRPAVKKGAVEDLLRESAEALALLREEGDLPLEGLREVRPLLKQARAEGASLLPEDLLSIRSTLAAAGRMKARLEAAPARFAILKSRGGEIPDFRGLARRLTSALGPRGEILDTASPELKHIRAGILRARNRLRRTLESLWDREELGKIFQEQIITMRNDRYVVAVKAEYKHHLPGIIHDQSQSKSTFFIEPLSTVEENNELHLLIKDEQEEERRILLALTAAVRERSGEVAQAVDTLGRLDLVLAKAKWADSCRATLPLLNDEGRWNLRDARHPLLPAASVVPIDLRLERGETTLIITGANTGGKTVALKTLGLLTLIGQCGIPIPAAEGSELAVFAQIFADIGDEQSLEENLSTFSAWLQAASRILQEAGPSSLVLLDEAGGGTDPAEGAALAMALIDALRERGARTAVTTHLNLLKAYGAIHADAVNVSVDFDARTLRPKYRLIYGSPGESHALLMAEKWGLPRELVERAEAYRGEGDRKVGVLLQKLEHARREMEARLREAQAREEEAARAREKAGALLDRARRQEEELLGRAREEALALVAKAREELRDLINDFKARGRTDLHRLAKAIQEEEERIRSLAPAGAREPGGKPSRGASPADLKRSLAPEQAGKKARLGGLIQYEVPSPPREINVIGLRVEEALPEVDKAIDDAFLGGLRELVIIHGAGTGRLRQAIRAHLQGHELVQGHLPGGPGRGGDGATVVRIGPASAAAHSPGRPQKEGTRRG